MDEDDNSKHGKNDSEATLDWYGMQLLCRVKGTNQIVQRSFPFWGPSIQFARDYAKKTNHLGKEERTYWTHIRVHTHIIETEKGSNTVAIETYEEKV